MTHCTDVQPHVACEALDMRQGSTYAATAQRLLQAES
jgi:hypothetical protein